MGHTTERSHSSVQPSSIKTLETAIEFLRDWTPLIFKKGLDEACLVILNGDMATVQQLGESSASMSRPSVMALMLARELQGQARNPRPGWHETVRSHTESYVWIDRFTKLESAAIRCGNETWGYCGRSCTEGLAILLFLLSKSRKANDAFVCAIAYEHPEHEEILRLHSALFATMRDMSAQFPPLTR